jgi:Transglycosylase SLT domain
MRKSLAVIAALDLVIAFTFSVSFSPAVDAMPAPTPGNIELSVGLAQWGAETEAPEGLSDDEVTATLQDLARPFPAGKSKTAMCETLVSAAQTHELPVGFFVRLINQESGFNPEIVSSAGAQGVAQFMPKVAEEWGLKNPFDPHAALVASARFLRSLYDQFGNWGLAAAAYNGGPTRVQKWIHKGGKLPDETRHYVMTITGVPAEKWVAGKSQDATFSVPARSPCQEVAHLAGAPSEPVETSPRAPKYLEAAVQSGPSPRATVVSPVRTTKVAVVTTKRGTKVAVIQVKGAGKVAAASGKIAQPKAIVASAGTASPRKGKQGKAPAVKVADKPASKSQAKAKDSKKSKGVQVADARGARK